MSNPKVKINGTEYELSTKLRVAYKVQGQNAHKPYAEIFQHIDTMTVEKQVEILYAAFEVANPEQVKAIPFLKFLDEYLDNYDIRTIMSQLQSIIGGILGQDLSEDVSYSETDTETEGN